MTAGRRLGNAAMGLFVVTAAVVTAAVVIAVGVFASPAGAATMFSFDSPSSDGAVLTSSPVSLAGRVAAQSGGHVHQVSVSVDWADTRPESTTPQPQDSAFNPNPYPLEYQWGVTPNLPDNGRYTVTVTALADTGAGTSATQSSATESFIQDVPPAKPTGVVDSIDSSAKVVYLSWNANPEADLIGYAVLRSGPTSSDPYKTIASVPAGTLSYNDTEVAQEASGIYRYEIVASRPSGTSTSRTDPSSPAAAPKAAQFGPPPTTAGPTTTAAGKPGPGASSTTPSSAAAPGGQTFQAAGPGRSHSEIVLPGVGSGLGGYQSLLGQAQSTTATTEPPDTGYNPNLPYQPSAGAKSIALPGDLGGGPLSNGNGGTKSKTVEFVAAALLLAVLAGFGLVLRRAADQGAPLEAVAPAGTASDVLRADAEGGSLLLTIFSQPSGQVVEPSGQVVGPPAVPVDLLEPYPDDDPRLVSVTTN